MYKFAHIEYGHARAVKCACPIELAMGPGDACIFERDKVQEFGHVKRLLADAPDSGAKGCPLVLRRATLQDQARSSENALLAKSASRLCQEKISKHGLELKPLETRYSFDRTRFFVYYTSEGYVDFRKFVQELASELRARVEMRQVGSREIAGLTGGIAPCGRPLCCATWMGDFNDIHIKMAKAQGLSLNPSAINGMCGKLKCCVAFEYNCYLDMARDMPADGATVETPEGRGKVKGRNLLSLKVKVEFADNRTRDFPLEEIRR